MNVPEPDCPRGYIWMPFYNGLDLYAHEALSSNPEAVRKLMDFGAESVAAMAATEEN